MQKEVVTADPETTAGINTLAEALKAAMQGGIAAASPKKHSDRPQHSIYHPEGVEKVPFTRRYFWKNAEIDWNLVTPEEAELLEALQPSKDGYHRQEAPNPTGGPARTVAQWTVKHRTDGNTAELFIDFPTGDADQRASLPSMKRMLREMVLGEPAD